MQIHELSTFSGTPGGSDYLAIDNGTETRKIALPAMTQAEAEAGSVNAARSVTPATFKAAVESISEDVAELREVLVISVASFSTLPQEVTNADITSDMVVVNSILGNPSAQTSDWTVTTSDGSLSVAGSISGSTTLTLYLMKSR